jgi:hypothetical protein
MSNYKIDCTYHHYRTFDSKPMGFLNPIFHLMNFLAPAMAVGVLLALAGPLLVGKSAIASPRIAQAAINVVAGSLALGLGLWFFGRDGKMASYAALLVVAATSQWIGGRGWR